MEIWGGLGGFGGVNQKKVFLATLGNSDPPGEIIQFLHCRVATTLENRENLENSGNLSTLENSGKTQGILLALREILQVTFNTFFVFLHNQTSVKFVPILELETLLEN